MKNIVLIITAGILITGCGGNSEQTSSIDTNQSVSKFHKIKPVGNSTYEFVDFATSLEGNVIAFVKAKGKTYTETYTYDIWCSENNIYSAKYYDDEEPLYNLVPGSSMYNIAKSACWMHYLAISEINYTEYLTNS